MERRLTVEFGPSRSKRFAKAVAEAERGPGECRELEPGRYRLSFVLGTDASVYSGLARLLERVRHWRASEVYEREEMVSSYQAKEMAWCASAQLKSFRDCRFRFYWGIPPRCSLCPLFDSERAIRDALGENRPAGNLLELSFGPSLRALLRGDLEVLAREPEPGWQVPDFPPAEWGEPASGEPGV
jgi:hypothetical protein